MSGGKFNYAQYHINTIAELIESLILGNKESAPNEWECMRGYHFPDKIIDKFKESIPILKQAYIYAQRIDWLVSGDDSPDMFLKRLAHDLKSVAGTALYTTPLSRKPLTVEQVEDEWERITGHSIFGGDRKEGRAMYLSPDEVMEFARAIERAHGIGD